MSAHHHEISRNRLSKATLAPFCSDATLASDLQIGRPSETGQPVALAVATEPPIPAPKPGYASALVQLFGPGAKPTVKGKSKPTLTKAQYDVVRALIEAGQDGLTKDQLGHRSGHGDARKIMQRLANSDPDWKRVLLFPGTTGKRYRIS